MTINTKYNENDLVWFLYEDKIQSANILKISKYQFNFPSIKYDLSFKTNSITGQNNLSLEENKLFENREILIKNL